VTVQENVINKILSSSVITLNCFVSYFMDTELY